MVAQVRHRAGDACQVKPANLHPLSIVGMLRELERVGVIPSADAIIQDMTHPTKPDHRPSDRRVFTELPDGVDDPAAVGSRWLPERL